MSKFPAVSTLHLVIASGIMMLALLGVKSNDLMRELLLPAARAETGAPAATASASLAQPIPAPPDSASAAPPVSDEERQLLQDLRARKQDLDGRENSVAIREAALSAAERRLSDRVQEMQALQDKLQTMQDADNKKSDASWDGLVAVYEAMKPDAAATILNTLEMPVLLQIFNRMKDRKAAVILSSMDPDRARLVTVELAKLRAAPNS